MCNSMACDTNINCFKGNSDMKKKNRSLLPMIYCVIFLAFLLGLLLIVIKAKSKKNPSQGFPTAPPVLTVTQSPTQTPTPNPVISSLTNYMAGEILSLENMDFSKLSQYFTASEIDDALLERIQGKSYRENPDISVNELRYLKILHYNFNEEIQVGELIVNEKIATDCLEIFQNLFEHKYEIKSMYLIDNYWTGDSSSTDEASMNADNSSGFCYRTIANTTKLSNHALGYAIDINPYENPYITYKNGQPVHHQDSGELYADRSVIREHMIDHNDLCYQLFTQKGFTWGGDWKNSKDYQHFEMTH